MGRRAQQPSAAVARCLEQARVARLATVDAEHQPHIVPICFAYDGKVFYSAIDRKPKRVSARGLTRLRNIAAEPRVALLIDHYEEDWSRLWYVLIRGTAQLLPASARRERTSALRRLRAKYPQYRAGGLLGEDAPIVLIRPDRFRSWSSRRK